MEKQLLKLTPLEFELAVRRILDAGGDGLADFRTAHLESIAGTDGEYIFDVTARFTALGGKFLVLIECKHQKRDVERSQVQILHSKLQSVGAQKGMLFSVSGFQEGAVRYAEKHGLALVQLQDECTTFFAKSSGHPGFQPTGRVIGWLRRGPSFSVVSSTDGRYMKAELEIPTVLAQPGIQPDGPASGRSAG